ncbi:MAG: SGNH/GDSL hydrolase family protein [Glaciimonas sp.]|nr:SGNH/GDSL hydrolase family protein [Glaciimonas sp.]
MPRLIRLACGVLQVPHLLGALFLFSTFTSSVFSASPPLLTNVKIDGRYNGVLSSSGPLSAEQLHKMGPPKTQQLRSATTLTSSPTYTYLRCFYRIDSNPLKPATNYVWGRQPGNNDYYRINGYWRGSGVFDWKNMFYTDTPQDALQSACASTLINAGVTTPPVMMAAADNQLSFNYTAWTNDVPTTSTRINKIIVFGDSLSDTQNLYNASQWKSPNANSWFLGRFSDDKVWVEHLANQLALPFYNWAVAGAAADTYIVIPGMEQQVQSWRDYMQVAHDYQVGNSLFTMLIGANDLINYNRTVDQIITAQRTALEKLINAGGRHILLLNLPDISRAPVFLLRSGRDIVAAQVVDYNQRLTALVSSLRTKYGATLDLNIFDANALFADLMSNPAKYQVSNTTDSCLNINSAASTNYLYKQTPRTICNNPDAFVFWDSLHPTSHTHKLLANSVAGFVSQRYLTVK